MAFPEAPMDLDERVRQEARLYQDAYLVAMQKPKAGPNDILPEQAARNAVHAFRSWLVSEGYVDLDATK